MHYFRETLENRRRLRKTCASSAAEERLKAGYALLQTNTWELRNALFHGNTSQRCIFRCRRTFENRIFTGHESSWERRVIESRRSLVNEVYTTVEKLSEIDVAQDDQRRIHSRLSDWGCGYLKTKRWWCHVVQRGTGQTVVRMNDKVVNTTQRQP